MGFKYNTLKFNTLTKDFVDKVYTLNFVKPERADLYLDFIVSLYLLIFNTYLGDKVTNHEQRKEHFKWCWDKNIDNFKKEGINFHTSKKLYIYLYTFINEFYYGIDDKSQNRLDGIINMSIEIFDIRQPKDEISLRIFIKTYKFFEDSLILC